MEWFTLVTLCFSVRKSIDLHQHGFGFPKLKADNHVFSVG